MSDELENLRRLHEVATERTVQLAAVIEAAKAVWHDPDNYAFGWKAHRILASADTSVLREVRAKAWEEGFATGLNEDDDYPNPYRQTGGESQ